ncbi:MAG TPA: hypothetical protein VFZ65_19380 [Planctomycetota bacterium]|nr:hypothetical protein [Planctomycetota bacterium]
MHKLSCLFSVVSLTAAAALAQQVTVPSIFATAEGGTTGNVWRAGTNRVQCFYDSTNFTLQGIGLPVTITNVEYRLAGGIAAAIVNYPSVEIYLQYSAVNFQTPSTTFSANRTVAFPTTPNFAGAVNTVAVSGSTPNDYFISIPLTTPFVYDPSTGQDLLMEIVILSNPAPLTGNTISAGFSNPAHLCNSIRSVGSTTALTGSASAFAPVARFTYTPVPGAGFNTSIGQGCYTKTRSFYEQFPGSSNDLSGQTVTMSLNGNGGYDVVTGAGGVVTPPTSVGLALGDDVVSAAIALPFTFDYPGGSTSTIFVDSNGSILLGVTGASNIGGSAVALLTSTSPRIAPAMMDILPDGATNVANVFAEVDPGNPGAFLITWNGTPCFGAVAPCTFQVALIDNGTSDTVEMRYQTLVNDSTSNSGICVTGFSLGGGAIDPGSSDLTAGLISTATDLHPLAVSGLTRPITGTNWNLQVSAVPATGVLGLEILGLGDPGINDLFFLGMPGCGLRTNLDVLNVYIPAGATHGYSLSIPPDPTLPGQNVFSTSAMFTVPALNAFGAITANSIQGTIGSL